MRLDLARLTDEVSIVADEKHLTVVIESGVDLDPPGDCFPPGDVPWPASLTATSAGAQFTLSVEQLLDRGLAELDGQRIRIPWDTYADAVADGLDIVAQWTEPSPFLLAIDRESDLGRRDFSYHCQYLLGGRPIPINRAGYCLQHGASARVFSLDPRTFALVDAMERYNNSSPEERSAADAWAAFAVIRRDADELGVKLDEYLASNTVVIPSSIALGFAYDKDGALSFVPECPELGSGEFATVFQRNRRAERVYSLDGEGDRRIRIVLDERQQAVLERMKRVQRVTGERRRQAERTPEAFFDGLLEDVEISYGPRVTGIGALELPTMPQNPRVGGILDDVLAGREQDRGQSASANGTEAGAATGASDAATLLDDTDPENRNRAYATLRVMQSAGNGTVDLSFNSPAELAAFREKVAAKVARGGTSVEHAGHTIAVDTELADALAKPHRAPHSLGQAGDKVLGAGPQSGKYLLIYTNEDQLRDDDVARASAAMRDFADGSFSLPKSLASDVVLKQHQVDGIRWLNRCAALAPDRRGALLADDMGLGKTLQVLVHLARLIEAGELKDDPGQGEEGPWRPILIIAPLMLVENETWPREIATRFRDDGEVFRPILTLHGSSINQVRSAMSPPGRETQLGQPLLAAEKLMQYRVVVTTYETVVNYQHSFAQLVQGRPIWSVIVGDEAQKYKMPRTKVSVALKALPSRFHIASTGTPVENRLLDLWNIVDTFQPALLGTATEFSQTYEAPLKHGRAEQSAALDQLRGRLRFGAQNAFLIRRTKKELVDLPAKEERRIVCEMMPAEYSSQQACLDVLGDDGQRGQHLAVLQRLALLSQHPFLSQEGIPQLSAAELIAASGKLRATIEALEAIHERDEKVILFARHVAVQNLLAYAIGAHFRVTVPIINGTTAGAAGQTRSSDRTRRTRTGRKQVLDDFKAKAGFGAIVLSPFVAGVGLTITEANHVVHYGRWWNPAVEAQATDRAYRIGQQRPVTVYYPILSNPAGVAGSSFDEALDSLLARKRALAEDFLHPASDEDDLAAELRADLLNRTPRSHSGSGEGTVLDRQAIDRLSAADFEALVAAMLAAEGQRAILTCQSGDGGADVVAVGQGGNIVVQVKHTRSEIDDDALRDVLAALDTYRGHLGGVWRASVVTNGRASQRCQRQAANLGVALVAGDELMRRVGSSGVLLTDVIRTAETRSPSFGAGLARIREAMDRLQ